MWLNARQAHWALFLGRFDVSISFRPGSKNVNPDALSHQFGTSENAMTMETILLNSCVVGVVVWGNEKLVKRALTYVTVPQRCPEGQLFAPESVRPAVLRLGHSSKLVAHSGVR